jgi:catechol 2,3-dioxygenase-like lactoylglutathione lyase family enzyme
MDQRLNFITIGADNLDKLKEFYIDKFGWTPIKDDDGIVFFKLNGFILSLYPANELAADAGILQDGLGFKRFTLSINYRSEDEVNQVFETLRNRGVAIIKSPQKVFWGGYSGYLKDIENNLWEIAFNPFLALNEVGGISAHQ